MSWKHELQLLDIDITSRLEVTCKKCGFMRYVDVSNLMEHSGNNQLFLDQIEDNMGCGFKGCAGNCRISLPSPANAEGFQGGLA